MRASKLERLWTSSMVFGLVVAAGCRSTAPAGEVPRLAQPPPVRATSPPGEPPPGEPPPAPPSPAPNAVEEGAAVDAPPPIPDELPLLRAFVDKASGWDAALGAELAQTSLAGTGAANSERALAYLEHRLLIDVLAPALRPSRDRAIVEVRQSIEQLVLFEVALPLANLKMGPADPAACGDCRWTGEPCTRHCLVERRFLEPANLAAGGLEASLDFGGHPRAGAAGLVYEGGASLGAFLDAVVSTGVPRAKVSASLGQLFLVWVARCRNFRPAEANQPLTARAALVDGIRAWQATYAPELPTFSNLGRGALTSRSIESAWNRFEVAVLRQLPSLRVYAAKLERVTRRNERLEHQLEQGAIQEFEYVARPDLDCEVQSPRVQGACFETTLGLEALRDAVFSLASSTPVAAGTPLGVAEALERLTLARLAARAVAVALERLCKDAGLVLA